MLKKLQLFIAVFLLSSSAFAQVPPTTNPIVQLEVNVWHKDQVQKGIIRIELFQDKAPITVKNFLAYVQSGFYNNTVFHRVIPHFMIQAGGHINDEHLTFKKGEAPIENEAKVSSLKNQFGTISMARSVDKDSASSEFFINTWNNEFLDYNPKEIEKVIQDKTLTEEDRTLRVNRYWGYAVFGKVFPGSEGMNTIKRIANLETSEKEVSYGGELFKFQDVPIHPAVITSIQVISP